MEPAMRDTPATLSLASSNAITSAYDYMPRNLAELKEFSEMMAKSDMIPKQYIDKPGNIAVAVQWGAEIDMKPLQAMQSIAVINNKPGLYGDAGKALLMARGCHIIEQDTREIEAQGYASCTIKRPGRPDVTRTFGLDDARRAKLTNKDGPWTNYPFRQMAWRAFWFAARDAAPDILRGMGGKEELEDMKDVTAEGAVVEREAAKAAASVTNGKTSALKERLRIVNIGDVVKAFENAADVESLAAALQKAEGIKDPGQQEQANNAYHAAKERIRKAQLPTGPTDDEVVTKLAAAKSTDDVQIIVDLLRPIQNDEARYAILLKRCVERAAELEPK